MIAPSQDRLSNDRLVTNVVYRTPSRLQALISFPLIFKGEHTKKKNIVKIVKGKKIKVTFNKTVHQITKQICYEKRRRYQEQYLLQSSLRKSVGKQYV